MKKIGRPKSDNPKNKMVGVRFDKDEYDDLMFLTECHHMNAQDTIRHLVRVNAKYVWPDKKRGE